VIVTHEEQQMSSDILRILFGVGLFLLSSISMSSQCRPGMFLVGEDEHYWYCSGPATTDTVRDVLQKENPELLGDQWRFRKAVMEAVASLARDGRIYEYGGKLLVTAQGTRTYICVSEECRGSTVDGVDCSGAAAYGELSACFVSGFCKAAGAARGLETSAAEQAEFFKRHKAWRSQSQTPIAGDLIFFRDTARNRKGITHVGIYVGTTRDGRTVILHASSRAGVVLFDDLAADLASKIAGYGDSSLLFATKTK
jgi:hypothetical protein